MQNNQLDLFGEARRPGFRLDRVEVYNWGTFHKHICHLNTARGQNLLTGDVGSGKSSLVDALTKLLVPSHKITFNKAAGAEKQERSLYTYIRGAYGNEQDPQTGTSRLLTLRDESSHSVILAAFTNESTQRTVTLAQVFRIKKGEKNPDHFYVFANENLSIEKDFLNVRKDISEIRQALRKRNFDVTESFKEYSTRFRQEFGIKSEQALDLFYQAVSMKSVGNLTEFIRQHMLEKTDIENQIEELCASFEDLRSAHAAILTARQQIDMLKPISELGLYHEQELNLHHSQVQCRELLQNYFATKKMELLEQAIARFKEKQEKNNQRIEKIEIDLGEERQDRFKLATALHDNGGGRIQSLEAEKQQREKERDRRRHQEQRYQEHCKNLELATPLSIDDFVAQKNEVQNKKQDLAKQQATAEQDFIAIKIEVSQLQKEEDLLNQEIESLRQRQSNIPFISLKVRDEIARALGLTEAELPFVGELLQVKPSEAKWEGAIERLLRNFGLSLLVADEHYDRVSRYVNDTHLRGKVVYFRVKAEKMSITRFSAQSLPSKIDFRRDSVFFDWLRHELESNFNFECCETIEEFQRHLKALSIKGQMKVSAKKHEKDDRYPVSDRSRYILGWSNKEKIRVLKEQLHQLQTQGQTKIEQVTGIVNKRASLTKQLQSCEGLLHFQTFEEIFWQGLAENIEELGKQIAKISQESDVLATLKGLIEAADKKIKELDTHLGELQKEDGKLGANISYHTALLKQTREILELGDAQLTATLSSEITRLAAEQNLLAELTLGNIEKRESELRKSIQSRIDALDKALGRKKDKIVLGIRDFLHSFKEYSVNFDAALESLGEVRALLKTLETEDLPRHETRFYKKLKEDTINGMAIFQELLLKEQRIIESKIEVINACLRDIDYNPGTYICLLPNKSIDQEIVQFRNDLRVILSNTMGPDSVYTEQKFLEVKNIIDRFKGRPQFLEVDRKWTHKVTDVRNWFTFAASERFQSDMTEKEFYPDAGGKSGGQKEKLAYTVLASALAYQYGIDGSQDTPKSFRFVMIDEAFGRGSDDSARYGLTLFEKLNLQLLVVTPLQKIHVIQDYVDYVHMVHNEGSKNSRIHSLTIEQFRALKSRRQTGHPAMTMKEEVLEPQ